MCKYILALVLVSLLLIASQITYAITRTPVIKVNEKEIELALEKNASKVTLKIENTLNETIFASVLVELLDPTNEVKAKVNNYKTLLSGNNLITLNFPDSTGQLIKEREILWYRLRYTITTELKENKSNQSYQGIVSLSDLLQSIFELKVTTNEYTSEGSHHQVKVLALHPISHKAVRNVGVTGKITVEESDGEKVLKATTLTDSSGQAILYFDIPKKLTNNELDLKVEGKLGEFSQEISQELRINAFTYISINTDKAIYQPDQDLNIRLLLFNSGKKAIVDEFVNLNIIDPEREVIFKSHLKTSRFGLANTTWHIPANIRLGSYSINVELENEKYENRTAYQEVKISRYQLPNFTVKTKTDQPYYLVGQNAQVTVTADYLFGKPVKTGKVRVVKESERYWNYEKQKLEITEDAVFEGKLDDKGEFLTTIILDDYKDEIDYYLQYKDIDFVAYVTDDSTNRTEQKRFSVRLSKYQIHIYQKSGDCNVKLPIEAYLSSFYADGTPAQCDISLYEIDETQSSNRDEKPKITGTPILTVTTNSYGVAKISSIELAQYYKTHDKSSLVFFAEDKSNRIGFQEARFFTSEKDIIKVTTNKTIYKPDEPIQVELLASKPDMFVVVDVISDSIVVESRQIALKTGKASFTVPYNKIFENRVTIAAYSIFDSESRYDFPHGSCDVIYPKNKDLKLAITLDKETYKPGDEAKVNFQVKTSFGQVRESALGITVIDKAVEERARTEEEFGKHSFYQAYNYLSGETDAIGEVTLKTIQELDLLKPITPDLDLVTAMLLADYDYRPSIQLTTYFKGNYQDLFTSAINSDVLPIKDTLNSTYSSSSIYPTNEVTFKALLNYLEPYFYRLRDPWGSPYRVVFYTKSNLSAMDIISAGVDKVFDTPDDFVVLNMGWPYFRPYGEILNLIVNEYHAKTKKYIQDIETLRAEFLKKGIDIDKLQDPYGNPYSFEFGAEKRDFVIKVISKGSPEGYQFYVWTTNINYFTELQDHIQKALDRNLEENNQFPKNETEFLELLKKANIGFSQAGIIPSIIQDMYGNIYDVKFSTKTVYNEKSEVITYNKLGEQSKEKIEVLSIKAETTNISIVSRGIDHLSGTYDDFEMAKFSHTISFPIVENKEDLSKFSVISATSTTSTKIIGLVTDKTGAVIAGALVKALNKSNLFSYTVTSNGNGEFVFDNILEGVYEIKVSADGFLVTVVDGVVVKASLAATVNISMQVGAASEIVEVAASSNVVETSVSTEIARKTESLPIIPKDFLNSNIPAQQFSTPRLREYFPETLFWQPELETTPDGQAKVKFKLADNITTWKMSVIGSTVDGEMGIAEKEFLAFQPFFVDIDPPTSLTEGDIISLPIILRNYLNHTQSVIMEIANQDWFSSRSPLKKNFEIMAGDFVREVFNFRAEHPVKKADQVVTVLGNEASDAIRRTIDVFPDGQEFVDTFGKVLDNSTTFEIDVPSNVLKSGRALELKLYTNLLAHLLESVEAILMRPYGCGEQTISSAYPSILLLKYLKENNKSMPLMETRAKRYLQIGYDRLLGYQNTVGAFTYWGRDSESDIALTAYAIRFLNDARVLIDVNPEQITVALNWLLVQQNFDGGWTPKYYYDEDKERKALLTANVMLTLAKSNIENNEEINNSIKKALEYLNNYCEKNSQTNPYILACLAQVNNKLGEKEKFAQIVNKLRKIAHKEKLGISWSINTNTPFYSWGLPEKIETTSLVIQALSQQERTSLSSDDLTNQGLLFLLSSKDRYGIWYSTQSTINVLDTLLAIVSKEQLSKKVVNKKMEVYVNDNLVKTLELPPMNEPVAPMSVDLSQFVTSENTKIEIRNAQGSVQVINTYYMPWLEKFGQINTQVPMDSGSAAKELELSVSFDKIQARVGEDITCFVKAARIGKNGYGMLLAEIGLPPGADVDRASLEKAMVESDWTFNRYDILPDRVVVYLWPWKKAINFSFKFHQRFGIEALTTRSIMYDYYNPEAKIVLAPIKFSVQEQAK